MPDELKAKLTYAKQSMGEGAYSNLVRAVVDRAIRKAIKDDKIPHYRYGPAYMETFEKWLWREYVRL